MLKIGLKDSVGQMLLSGENLSPFHIVAPSNANHARYSAITFIELDADWSVSSPCASSDSSAERS